MSFSLLTPLFDMQELSCNKLPPVAKAAEEPAKVLIKSLLVVMIIYHRKESLLSVTNIVKIFGYASFLYFCMQSENLIGIDVNHEVVTPNERPV